MDKEKGENLILIIQKIIETGEKANFCYSDPDGVRIIQEPLHTLFLPFLKERNET